MLYMFNVDVGTMVTFDINLGMELVSVLQERIAKELNVPVDMQVLLVSGGITLLSHHRVTNFAAGTDTNPIFLYNRQFYHLQSSIAPAELLVVDKGPEQPNLDVQVDASLLQPDTIKTVEARSILAQQFFASAEAEAAVCERLVHEQHLMHQGYATVIANMDDTIPSVQAEIDDFLMCYEEFLEKKQNYIQLSQTVSEVTSTLATIPLLPPLVDIAAVDPAVSMSSSEQMIHRRESLTLLDWLNLRDTNDSFHNLSELCSHTIEQLDEPSVNAMREMMVTATFTSKEHNMRHIKGLPERFSALDKLLLEIRTAVSEQRDIASAFQQNAQRAKTLGDSSILPDLCASHRRQLMVMQANHKKIKDISRRIVQSKLELIQNIYMRMKWVNHVETDIGAVHERTSMYKTSLKFLKEQLTILQQMHNIPHIYLTAVAEVVRRRSFSQSFLLWANNMACQICDVHSDEVARRQHFKTQFEGHILNSLFPGFEDSPPPYATQAPDSFDCKLPMLSLSDLNTLKEKISDFTLSVSMTDLNFVTDFFSSKIITNKPKEVNRLAEEVMEQPLDSEAASPAYLVSALPTLERGFESETDTEEFEKVGPSPTDMTFEKRADTLNKEKMILVAKSKEVLEKSIVSIRNDLGALRDWLKVESSHVYNIFGQLSVAYTSEMDHNDQLIYNLKTDLVEKETEISELKSIIGELQQKLSLSIASEAKEVAARVQAEEMREAAIRQAASVRNRVRLSSSTIMDRSTSEQSLEIMDQGSLDGYDAGTVSRAELLEERDRAVAEERQMWQTRLNNELTEAKLRADAEKQIWFNETMRRVIVEKDRQIDELRMHSIHLETECQKQKETILRLTGGSSRSMEGDSSLLERVTSLEATKVKLEEESSEAQLLASCYVSLSTPSTSNQDNMCTSIARCDSEATLNTLKAAPSTPEHQNSQFNEKLNETATLMIQQGKVSVHSCNIGEAVLVVWEEKYRSFMILQESSTQYFLHSDSLAAMSLSPPADDNPRRIYTVAVVKEKEYCHAKKAVNRYNVDKGSKFYRVKVRPVGTMLYLSQSSSGCSA